MQDATPSKEIWDNLAKLHQMADKNYKADIEERMTTLRMSEGDDPAKFLELFSTLLLKAQTANFKLSEEDKATYFLRALPVTYESLKSEWKSLQRIKEITKQPTSTFEDLRGMFNTYIADFKRQDEVRLQTAMMVRKASHGQQRRNFGQGQQRNHNKKTLSC